MAREKTEAAEVKLASVGKLEEENATLRTAIKEEKTVLTDKVDQLTQKRNKLEDYLGNLAQKMYTMLEGIFPCPSKL